MVVSWDLANPESGQLIAKLPNSVYALHHHPESDLLIAGHNYEGIHLLDWQNKREAGSLQLTKAAIFDIQSTGQHLLVATGEGSLIKVDIRNLTVAGKFSHLKKVHVRLLSVRLGERSQWATVTSAFVFLTWMI